MAVKDKSARNEAKHRIVDILESRKTAPRTVLDERIDASSVVISDAISSLVSADKIRVTGSEPALHKLVVGDCAVCGGEVLGDDAFEVTISHHGCDWSDEYVVHTSCKGFIIGGLD